MKRKRVIPLIIIYIIIVLGAGFIYGDRLAIETTVEYWVSEGANSFEHLPLKEGVVQEVIAEYDKLNEFILFFDNYSPQDCARACVVLEDDMGEIYYKWEVPTEAIGGEVFCLMGIPEKELNKGEKYYIKAYLSEGNSDMTVRAVEAENTRRSVGTVSLAEEEKDVKLYLFQSYTKTGSHLFIWGMVLGVTFVALLLLAVSKKQKWMYLWYGLSDIILIVSAYYIMESLSGNLQEIEVKNALVNCLLITSFYIFLRAVFVKKAYYITGIAATLMGLTNFYVLQFRGTEFLYTDVKSFFTAMSVAGSYEFTFPPVVFNGLLILTSLFVVRFLINKKYQETNSHMSVFVRIGHIIPSILVTVFIGTHLNRAEFDFFNLSNSFSKFGWCYTNLYLMRFSDVDKPDGYSEKEVERIATQVAAVEYESEEIIAENIIVIMNESLSDLQTLGALETNRDYLPFIHSLDENTVQGDLHVPTYGGGTSLTEYEFLTGNLQHFLPTSTVPYSSVCEESEEGICKTLKAQGYYTVAMHPYDPTNWNRDKVYTAMGFDEFLSEEDYEDSERIRNFVSDKACYEKIIEYYETSEHEGGLFFFNVTMQNHGGYDKTNGTLDGEITINNFESEAGERYLSLVYESDRAFEYLVDYFTKVEEPTMILMFGDHLPALSDEFYENVYGKEKDEQSKEEKSSLFVTPYILWTNYDSDFEEIPQMSANYLGSYLLQCAGVEMPIYNQFLVQCLEENPVLGVYGIKNENGTWTDYRNSKEQMIEDYKILQYMRVEDRKSKLYSIFQCE